MWVRTQLSNHENIIVLWLSSPLNTALPGARSTGESSACPSAYSYILRAVRSTYKPQSVWVARGIIIDIITARTRVRQRKPWSRYQLCACPPRPCHPTWALQARTYRAAVRALFGVSARCTVVLQVRSKKGVGPDKKKRYVYDVVVLLEAGLSQRRFIRRFRNHSEIWGLQNWQLCFWACINAFAGVRNLEFELISSRK